MAADDLRSRFERLAIPLQEDLYRSARALTGSDADALDLVQETYLRALRAFAGYRDQQQAKAWLFTILRHVHIDIRRRKRLEPVSFDPAEAPETAAPEPLPKDLLPEHTAAALSRLKPAHHLILLLREVQGFTYKEIAEILGIPMGTVMSSLHAARGELRRELDRREA